MAKIASLIIAAAMILMALGTTAIASGEPVTSEGAVANVSQHNVTPLNITAYIYGLIWSAESGKYGNWTLSMHSPLPMKIPINYSSAPKSISLNFSSSTEIEYTFSGMHHGNSLWVANPHAVQNSLEFAGYSTIVLGGYIIFNGSTPSDNNFVALALFAWIYIPPEYIENDSSYIQTRPTYLQCIHTWP